MAFTTIAVIETCFKKATGLFVDLSEQQLIDCAYDEVDAGGCDGAYTDTYLRWIQANPDTGLVTENEYPYLWEEPNLYCPADLTTHKNTIARVTNYAYSTNTNEDILKAAVYKHGAVSASMMWTQEFEDYTGGIFDSCEPGAVTDHSVVVVGYGRENGVDYWLIKNSWGTDWGYDGFMKLQRGVQMCGIGQKLAYVECEATDQGNYNYIESENSDYDQIKTEDFSYNEQKSITNSECQDLSVNCENFPESTCQNSESFNRDCQQYCQSC